MMIFLLAATNPPRISQLGSETSITDPALEEKSMLPPALPPQQRGRAGLVTYPAERRIQEMNAPPPPSAPQSIKIRRNTVTNPQAGILPSLLPESRAEFRAQTVQGPVRENIRKKAQDFTVHLPMLQLSKPSLVTEEPALPTPSHQKKEGKKAHRKALEIARPTSITITTNEPIPDTTPSTSLAIAPQTTYDMAHAIDSLAADIPHYVAPQITNKTKATTELKTPNEITTSPPLMKNPISKHVRIQEPEPETEALQYFNLLKEFEQIAIKAQKDFLSLNQLWRDSHDGDDVPPYLIAQLQLLIQSLESLVKCAKEAKTTEEKTYFISNLLKTRSTIFTQLDDFEEFVIGEAEKTKVQTDQGFQEIMHNLKKEKSNLFEEWQSIIESYQEINQAIDPLLESDIQNQLSGVRQLIKQLQKSEMDKRAPLLQEIRGIFKELHKEKFGQLRRPLERELPTEAVYRA